MDIIKTATDYCKKQIEQYPDLTREINSFYSLFRMELEDDCCSWDNEWELLYSDVENLIEEYKMNTTA
jgi:hypothetical protein